MTAVSEESSEKACEQWQKLCCPVLSCSVTSWYDALRSTLLYSCMLSVDSKSRRNSSISLGELTPQTPPPRTAPRMPTSFPTCCHTHRVWISTSEHHGEIRCSGGHSPDYGRLCPAQFQSTASPSPPDGDTQCYHATAPSPHTASRADP